MNQLFTSTPDGDAVPPQAAHIMFKQFTGITASHGDAVRWDSVPFITCPVGQ